MFPTFKEISDGEMVETATGVSRTFAISITSDVTVISSNMLNKESAEAEASWALKLKEASNAPANSKAFFMFVCEMVICCVKI